MLNILVDESYAFDFLSILDVKLAKHNDEKTQKYKDEVIKFLTMQLSNDLVKQILNSNEYQECIAANEKMFDLVDDAKTDKVTAQEVDKGNYVRCLAKNALQLKFFNTSSTEIKTGYDKYSRKDNAS